MKKLDRELAATRTVIRTRRLELNRSQEALAEKTGVHRTYVSLFEITSCNITMRMFLEFAYALGLSPSELLAQASTLKNIDKKPKVSEAWLKLREKSPAKRATEQR